MPDWAGLILGQIPCCTEKERPQSNIQGGGMCGDDLELTGS